MHLEELKRGLWGYRKDAVFQYIAQQEEQFAQKMAEKDAQMEQRNQQDSLHIQALEQENRALKEELARLRAQQDQISQAILDARSSAEALKAESRAQEETARETIRQALERDLAELAGYRNKIETLRQTIQAALECMEEQAETMEEQAAKLAAAAPEGNLTLFQ